jgi:F-type H+-transporting ATPase subunit delta
MTNPSRTSVARHVAKKWVDKSVSRKKLVAYLIDSKKTHEAELLVNDVKKFIAQDHGIVVAEAVSARPLSEQLQKHISAYVKDKTGAQKVALQSSIDESLIGGVVVRTPEREFDMSVRGKLNSLKGVK